ncbi:MAG: DUF1294 domain-containing protein [Firmicutes bacterium]|nr:DUF1294 domain-containing protein [Bacillota bacterium]
MVKVIVGVYLAWNLIVFLMYGIDKLKAKNGSYRISEFTLLWCAFVMGAIGAFFGSKVFHHKTQKTKFKILLPLALIINILVDVCFVCRVKGII